MHQIIDSAHVPAHRNPPVFRMPPPVGKAANGRQAGRPTSRPGDGAGIPAHRPAVRHRDRVRSRTAALAGGIVLTLLSACVQGPDYVRPTVPMQTGWKESPATATTNAPVLPGEWWTLFNDPELNALESRAVGANQDLQRALARVSEARAIARVSKADRFPTLSASGGYSRNRSSENVENSLPEPEYDLFSHTVDVSYELDVWGRVRRHVEAAEADATAVATDLQVVLLTLTADVARHYQLLRSLDNERAVMEATISLRRDTVQLQQTRYQAGLINDVDVTRARTEQATVEADLQAIVRERAQIEHALAVLCGQAPAEFSITPRTTQVVPPEVPAGLPSALMERRPDIVEAEQRLQAANARIGASQAEFFPKITLTSTAGIASADLGTLVDWPSRLASFGPSITIPLFEGGRNQANLKAAQARYEQAVAGYRGTILQAFREVEDSLTDLSTLAFQADAVSRALTSARETFSLTSERYERGLSSYLDVVDAQRAALQAERQDVQLRGQQAVSAIRLAKALGGGWDGANDVHRFRPE